MKNTIVIVILTFLFFSCSKKDTSVPSAPSGSGQGTTPTIHTNFIYTGTMQVTKFDSTWNAIANYPIADINSKIVGTKPDYTLSTTFDASNLKGTTNNVIPVNILTKYFMEYNGGTGIFIDGVTNGYYTGDSLLYRVLYKDAAKNNIYLDYSGKLTSSY